MGDVSTDKTKRDDVFILCNKGPSMARCIMTNVALKDVTKYMDEIEAVPVSMSLCTKTQRNNFQRTILIYSGHCPSATLAIRGLKTPSLPLEYKYGFLTSSLE